MVNTPYARLVNWSLFAEVGMCCQEIKHYGVGRVTE